MRVTAAGATHAGYGHVVLLGMYAPYPRPWHEATLAHAGDRPALGFLPRVLDETHGH